jgi:hypothetical protein
MTKCNAKCSERGLVCNPGSGRCVNPDGKVGRALTKKTTKTKKTFPAGADHAITTTLDTIGEFEELYQEERSGLERNIKNGHKRSVLSRLFHSAKKSVSGLLSLVRKYPAYALLIIAVMVSGGATAVAMSRPDSWLAKALGTLKTSDLKNLKPTEFIKNYWEVARTYVREHGGSEFMTAMNSFATQLAGIREYLGTKWTALTIPILALWNALKGKLEEFYKGYMAKKNVNAKQVLENHNRSPLSPNNKKRHVNTYRTRYETDAAMRGNREFFKGQLTPNQYAKVVDTWQTHGDMGSMPTNMHSLADIHGFKRGIFGTFSKPGATPEMRERLDEQLKAAGYKKDWFGRWHDQSIPKHVGLLGKGGLLDS